MLRQLQVQRCKYRLLQGQEHTDCRVPAAHGIRVGTHGTHVQQPAQGPVCQPHQATASQAQRRPEARGRNHAVHPTQQVRVV